MSEEMLVLYGAPTLAGIKTGSLFTCPYTTREELWQDIRRINRRIAAKGMRVIPLRLMETRALIYLYRPDKLRCDLAHPEAAGLLEGAGYGAPSRGGYLAELMRRLSLGGDFPHEIGLFLSYPPEDVRGFIENHGKNEKLLGMWKVYGDAEAAARLFKRYKMCTDCYAKSWKKGVPIERLAVACG